MQVNCLHNLNTALSSGRFIIKPKCITPKLSKYDISMMFVVKQSLAQLFMCSIN